MAQHNQNSPGGSDEASFEQLLRSVMQARPEPIAPADLAMRAVDKANTTSAIDVAARRQRLAQQRRWMQITGIAATLLITAMLVVAAQRMWTRGDIAAIAEAASSDTSTSATSSDGDSSSSTSSSSSTTNTIAIVVVAELLVMGIVLLSTSRTGPQLPWGAEAAGGFW